MLPPPEEPSYERSEHAAPYPLGGVRFLVYIKCMKNFSFRGAQWWKEPLTFAATWLGVINVFAYIALNRLNMGEDTAYRWLASTEFGPRHSWNPIPLHIGWDSGWYLSIVEHGYEFHGAGQFANLVFFPLYPFLVKVVGVLVGGHYGVAGILVSAFALLGASVALWALVRDFHPAVNPKIVLVAMLLFPTAFFFSLVYTESLFLLLSVLSIYMGRKERWWAAGLIGILAALTRVTGLLLVIPLAWEYARSCGFSPRRMLRVNVVAPLLPALGTLAFFTYHYLAFGDFLLFFHIESVWGRSFSFNSDHFQFFSHPAITNAALDISFVVFGLALVAYVAWRVRFSYALYMLATMGAALGSGTTMSIGRYLLVLFPMYIAIATIKNEYVRWAWLLLSGLLLALYTILFIHGHWAG